MPPASTVQTPASEPPSSNNPYVALIQAIQVSQEKDARALREMVESRQANLAIIRAIQNSDATTVATFEKLLQVLKGPQATPVSTPTATPEKPARMNPAANKTASTPPGELSHIVKDLENLSKNVQNLSIQVEGKLTNK
jgi:hypothetical protein